MTAWDPSRFWPAMKRAGMLTSITFALPDCPEPVTIDVTFRTPDDFMATGARSREYVIDYQYHDAPTLNEGVFGEVAEDDPHAGTYRVRESPYVPADRDSGSGFFRRCRLTREPA